MLEERPTGWSPRIAGSAKVRDAPTAQPEL